MEDYPMAKYTITTLFRQPYEYTFKIGSAMDLKALSRIKGTVNFRK
jgi:hypothetical protein